MKRPYVLACASVAIGGVVLALALRAPAARTPPSLGIALANDAAPFDSGSLHAEFLVDSRVALLLRLRDLFDVRHGLATIADGAVLPVPGVNYNSTTHLPDPTNPTMHVYAPHLTGTFDDAGQPQWRLLVTDADRAMLRAIVAADPQLADAGLPDPVSAQ